MYKQEQWKTGDTVTADKLNNIENGIVKSSSVSYPYVSLVGDVSGMSKDVEKTLAVEYYNGNQIEKGYAKVSWQGDSSVNYPKKNYKIKLYSDAELTKKLKITPRSGWIPDNKFNLKANWVDATSARNIVNSRVWAQLTKSRVYNPSHNRDVNYAMDSNFENMVEYWNGNTSLYKLGDKTVDGYNTIQYDGTTSPNASYSYPGSNNVTTYASPAGANFKMSAVNGDKIDVNLKALVTQHNTSATSVYNGDLVIAVKEMKENSATDGSSAWKSQKVFIGTSTTDFEKLSYQYTITGTSTKYLTVAFWFVGNAKGYASQFQVNKNVTTVPPYQKNPLDDYFKSADAQNYGSIDGFPVELYINGSSAGMYTFNLTKNSKLFGLDGDNINHVAISGALGNGTIPTTQPAQGTFSLLDTKTAKLDGSDYNIESDNDLTPDMVTKFNKLLTFINTASEDEFKANAGTYIDINSVIDAWIFAVQSMNIDTFTKSYVLYTHDGYFWKMATYDNDTTWKLRLAGTVVFKKSDYYINTTLIRGMYNRLFWRVIADFNSEIVTRWNDVKGNSLSVDNYTTQFKNFIQSVNPELYKVEHNIWSQKPSIANFTLQQLQSAIITNTKHVDSFILGFPSYDSFPTPTLLT